VAPTNRRQKRQQSKWWHQTRQFIIFKCNNQPVAPTNPPVARKAAKASGGDKRGNNLSVVTKAATATRGSDSSTIKRW